jgi:uncharacterized protein with ParB-like and HNH nuclease domain
MNAQDFTLAQLFNQGGGIQYMVPYFQRQYTWTERDWRLLLDDVVLLYNDKDSDDSTEHFMGSVVVVPGGSAGAAPRYTLIDGQQRLITISLLLKSLDTVGHNELGDRQPYLVSFLTNTLEKNKNLLKVLPSEKKQDRETYDAVLEGRGAPQTDSAIPQAYDFFVRELRNLKSTTTVDFERMFDTVTKHLMFIRIETIPSEKPYRIFESLNARGEPLTQGDLIRNYVAMRLPDPADQDEVFKGSWGIIDDLLNDSLKAGKSGLGELTAFIRHYLATISGVLYDERNVYQEFRNYAERNAEGTKQFKDLISRLAQYAEYYDRLLRPEHEPQKETASLLSSLELFDQSASYPFLLQAYGSMAEGKITRQRFNDMAKQLEGYFVRRFLCGYPTNYTTKQLPQVWLEVADQADPVAALRVALGKRKSPTDQDLSEEIIHEQLYQTTMATPRISHVLLAVSHHVATDVDADPILSPTIEHIMPQTLSQEWRTELGQDAEAIQSRFGDTLANLTLVPQGWNSQLSNKPFTEKRTKLVESKLPLNCDYFSRAGDSWGVSEIVQRGQWLADVLASVYPEFPQNTEPHASTSGMSPRGLRLDGKLILVSSWRDITLQTVLYIAEHGGFETVRSAAPQYFRREDELPVWPPRWRRLPNGWRLYTNFSGKGTARFCGHMLSTAGLASVEWKPVFDLKEAQEQE